MRTLGSCATSWPRLPEAAAPLKRQTATRHLRLAGVEYSGLRRCRAVELDDVDTNRCGQARRGAVALDLGHQLAHRHSAMPRNAGERIPHRRLKPDAGSVVGDNDIAD